MFRFVLLALALAASAVAPALAADPAKVLVLRTRIDRGLDAALAPTVTELVIDALGRAPALSALGETDVSAFLDAGTQKQLSSCDDDAACMIELGGTLGTEYLLMTSVGAIGQNYLVTARLFDARQGVPVARESAQVARSEDVLAQAVCPLVHALFGAALAKDARLALSASRCAAVAPPAMPPAADAFPAPPAATSPAASPAPPGLAAAVPAAPRRPAAAPVVGRPAGYPYTVPTLTRTLQEPPLEGAPEAVAQYEQKRIVVETTPRMDSHGRVNGHDASFYSGRYRTPLLPEVLYDKIGRADLVAALVQNEARRRSRLWIATGALVATYAIGVPVFLSGPSGDNDGYRAAGSFIMLGGTAASLGLFVWAGRSTEPVSRDEARRLAEDYNERLRRELGVSYVQ